MTLMSEKFGVPLPPLAPIRSDEEEDEIGGSFIPPPDHHPSMHSHPRSPPPPFSASDTTPVVKEFYCRCYCILHLHYIKHL
jgi:hypothetical protein